MKENNPNLDYYAFALNKNESVEPPLAATPQTQPPSPQPPTDQNFSAQREQTARRAFSRIGISVVVMIGVWLSLNLLISIFALAANPDLITSPTFAMFSSTLPLICIAIPVAYAIVKNMPSVKPEVQPPIGAAKLVIVLFACMGIMIAGNLISNLAMSFFSAITGLEPANSLDVVLDAPIWVVTLCAVILSPIFEEILCRGFLLRRLLPYGEIPAIMISSIIFACIHGNLFQFVYAFGIGVVFSILYLRTGRFGYCVILHIIINALGSLFSVFFLSQMDPDFAKILLEGANIAVNDPAFLEMMLENIVPLMLMGLYSMTEYAMAFAGILLIILGWRKVKIVRKENDLSLSRTLSLAAASVGGVLLIIVAVFFTMMNMGFIGA
ncbi:MAG: CPBP family intramembrane metalloprotease [Clostridia bacterium]|nr:CPBP family intramembrane metalloprotease [Clostridia bacterium]